MLLLALLPVTGASAQTGSDTVSLKNPDEKQGNWLQRRIDARLEKMDEKKDRPVDYRWKFKPGLGFDMKRKGLNWSVGPRLGLAKRTSEHGQFSLNGEYVPIRFQDLSSGSRIEYSRFDVGYRHYLNSRLYAGVGFTTHLFDPTADFEADIKKLGGTAKEKWMSTASVSMGQQVFRIDYSYRGRKRALPFFLVMTYQFADDYQYGANLGEAGSEYRIRSGFSFRIRPLFRKF